MPLLDQLHDAKYEGLLTVVWDFLAPSAPARASDVIFVFGGIDLAVPGYAAVLYHAQIAPWVLLTGNAGALTASVFDGREADVFKEVLLSADVPDRAIVSEREATNTGRNVSLGMAAMADRGISVSSVVAVAKPFITRRCLATFELQFPGVQVIPCPPPGRILGFLDRSRQDFAARLLAELERLDDYAEQGFLVRQPVPQPVLDAASELRTLLSKEPD